MLYESIKHEAKAVTPSVNSMFFCADLRIIIVKIVIIIIIITTTTVVSKRRISIAVQWRFTTNKEALTVPCFVVKQFGSGFLEQST